MATSTYTAPATEKKMNAKFPGTCSVCRDSFRKTDPIFFNSATRQCRHTCCEITAPAATARVCQCRCDGWCEMCDPMGCFANNHGRN